VIKYTALEQLKTTKEKFRFIEAHGHPFAKKRGIIFNPYAPVPKDPNFCQRIPRPPGTCGVDWLLHEAMGLRVDYDKYCDIRVSVGSAMLLILIYCRELFG
jgi:hypothetical protein